MKKIIIASILLAIIALIGGLSLRSEPSPQVPTVASTSSGSSGMPQRPSAVPTVAATDLVPAYYKTAPPANTLPPTLSPALFTGNERLAYQAAKEIPQTLAQMPCYCHCDKGHGHQSLHSCFESEHGESCGTCIGEALMAHQLKKSAKLTDAEIREQIIAAYGSQGDE